MSSSQKIYPREKLIPIIAKLKKEGKTIGVTNGAFDLLHAGHVKYLEDAKKLCDILVVSLNTDESVRLYKDSNRPINSEEDRAMVIAGLTSVDYVTFHSERRMRDTLLAFEPNFYIKGGDYNSESLTSKDVLDSWNGQVAFIPLLEGRSTTKVIEKVTNLYKDLPIELPFKEKKNQKAIFLDRDGVINEELEYVSNQKDFHILPHVFEGLKELQSGGFLLVVVTNQAGIGLGYYTKEDFYNVNKKMLHEFHSNGIVISKIYFCPHSLSENCNCRKPKIGMFERAKEDLSLDMGGSWMIGNTGGDIQAGKSAGCRTILIQENPIVKTVPKPDFATKNLLEAAEIIKSSH